jgi:hypothetical protein
MLLHISVYLIGSIARQLGEASNVLIHRHGSLLQIMELLLLELHHTFRNMVSAKSCSKLRPVDALRFLMCFYIGFPSVGCRS